MGALSEEEKTKRKEAEAERMKEYEEKVKEFNETPAGKKYQLQCKSFEKRKRVAILKSIMMKKEPKKPPSPEEMFAAAKTEEIKKESPDLSAAALKEKVDEMWKALGDGDKKEWQNKEKEAQEKYEKDKAAFANSPA